MKKDNLDVTEVNAADLLPLLIEMNDALARHTKFLEKHYASMETLGKSIKQLNDTIQKLTKTETASLQLSQALNTFVEQQINPLYYQCDMYTALPAPQHTTRHRTPKGELPPPGF